MHSKPLSRFALAIMCVGLSAGWGCAGNGHSTPTAPAQLGASRTSTLQGGAALRPSDDEGYPAPETPSEPAPGNPPEPSPEMPGPAPEVPAAPPPEIPSDTFPMIINIVGTFGARAYVPNPLIAAMGNMIVWKNDDGRVHHIVLDGIEGIDPVDVGDIAPGKTSVPIPLARPVAGYHCTIHPNMVGVISDGSMPLPPSTEPPEEGYPGYYFSPFGKRSARR